MEYKIGTDARCAVIGYGSWATAIVGLLAANGRRVGWYVRNPEVLESLCSDGRNPRYLNDLEFDRNSIAPSSDLDAVVRDADIVILATPSAYLKDFLAPLTVPLRDKFVVSAIKGIVPGDYQTVVEYIHDHYGLSYRQIGLVTGPSHAEEVSRGKLSYLTVACIDSATFAANLPLFFGVYIVGSLVFNGGCVLLMKPARYLAARSVKADA